MNLDLGISPRILARLILQTLIFCTVVVKGLEIYFGILGVGR